LGRGGHARETASRLVSGRLIGIDRDGEAISACAKSLAVFGDRITLVRGDFGEIGEILDNLGIDKVDGMLFDLGLSSPQIDEAERGFSYMSDAPLDMRMDRSAALTAREIVNGWDESELKRILYEYGEERYASKIAASIIAARRRREISTTLELAEVIKSAMPASATIFSMSGLRGPSPTNSI
jgi:16S rRNA (cytosine1402-N4)-methyltransferase